jgi:hypothetical protein
MLPAPHGATTNLVLNVDAVSPPRIVPRAGAWQGMRGGVNGNANANGDEETASSYTYPFPAKRCPYTRCESVNA